MNLRTRIRAALLAGTTLAVVQFATPARADDGGDGHRNAAATLLPTGQYITPTALRGAVQQYLNPGLAAYPNFVAGEAVRSQLSPDGTTLAVLCAGQNSLVKPDGTVDAANSTQYLFLFDVRGPNAAKPKLVQVIQQPNAHVGLVFSPDGRTLYAAGGNDDAVYAYTMANGAWTLAAKIALNHAAGVGIRVQPNAGGLAISADGKTLVVANNYNDSISVIDTASRSVRYEHDLRPYFANNEGVSGAAGGTFPFAVRILGNDTAYVSSDRDREIVVVDISAPSQGHLVRRIHLDGNALGMTLNAKGTRLYVAEDNVDQVAVIDTASNAVIARIDTRGPEGLLGERDDRDHGGGAPHYTGAAPFAVTLSPDGQMLYAVNAGANSIAVIPTSGELAHRVIGLIPTAYDPHDVTFSADGKWMYVVNGKSDQGPNPGHLSAATALITNVAYPGGSAAAAVAAAASNEYQFQLERASLVSAPVPGWNELPGLTGLVARNDHYVGERRDRDEETMEFLRHHIKHVIYVIKENRTFDQILGDLGNGSNGDASLTQFGAAITPNFHAIARQFVTLDNFLDPSDGSMDGWSWSLQGRVTNTETLTQQINYAFVNRGLSYESEGANRNVPVNFGTVAQRDAAAGPAGTTNYSLLTASQPGGTANVLAGTGNHASSDAPWGAQKGYIFDAVLQAGKTVRNYGFLVNNIGPIGTQAAPVANPFAANAVQVAPLNAELAPYTDVYFRGFDQNYPDLWRYNEWKREFDAYVSNGNLPDLVQVRLSHDHMGSFATALAGVNTPEAEQADDDLAVGLLLQALAQSPYAKDTLVFVTEDDSQDGPDHVDSHRSTAYVVGPYVKQGVVVSTRYSQVNALRTMEDVLGTPHLNLNTAYQRPMTDVFDVNASGHWTYTATASTVLKTTMLAANGAVGGAPFAAGPDVKPRHSAAYWARVTRSFDFSDADRVPPQAYNRVLWRGLSGNKPMPASISKGDVARADND